MNGFLHEMRRRNVWRAAALYATSVWALAQGISSLGPTLNLPDWTTRGFLVAAAIGFPFWIAFAWFYELTPQGIKPESEVVQNESLSRATGRRLDFWIIAGLAIAVVLLLTDKFVVRKNANTGAVIADRSIAVLPLVNESGDPNALYFSDGLSEDLINALSQFPGLKVIGRNSSFTFRGSTKASNAIGETLGVTHLLEGSVLRAGNAVRINAELINARDGSTLWSAHYDRPYKDLFQLQDDITNAVATALKTKLLGGDMPDPQSLHPPSGNLDAYSAFLMGQFFVERRNAADFHRAIDAYTTATAIDPRYAQAWAGLSIAQTDLAAGYLGSVPSQQVFDKARAAAHTALALAPNMASAHLALGTLAQFADADYSAAEAEFQRAEQLMPNGVAEKSDLAHTLATLGRPQEAAKLIQQAVEIDPLQASLDYNLSIALSALGRLDEAEKAVRKALVLQPNADGYYEQLTVVEILRGNATAALIAARQTPPSVWTDIAVTLALQIGDDHAAADAALKSLTGKFADDGPYQIAQVYAVRKDPDNMFTWLDHALAVHDNGVTNLLYDPLILPYRNDPRFAAICRKAGLPTTTDATIGFVAR
jgi:TolB-like protein/tetratricopeptide (TPR) repeat protein